MVNGFFCWIGKVEVLASHSKTLLDLLYVKHFRLVKCKITWLWAVCAIATLPC